MKRCLLDMDGVLVSFNQGACQLFGRDDPYQDPANHGKWDLDELLGLSREEFFAPMGEAFWAGLEPTPECFNLVRLIETVFGRDNVALLTSPVVTHGCYEGKLRWVRRHLPQYARRCLVGPAKEFAAGPQAWLVDDHDRNISKFLRWGGNAIQVPRPWNRLHRDSGNTLAAVERALKEV